MHLIWNNGIHSMHEAVASGHFIIQSTAAPVMSHDMSDMFDYNAGSVCIGDQVILAKKDMELSSIFESREWALVATQDHIRERVMEAMWHLGCAVQVYSAVGLFTEHQKALRRKAGAS